MSDDNDKIFNEDAPKYPERASGDKDPNSMLMAYAGPRDAQIPMSQMMAVYAGPDQNNTPIGFDYAGPNQMSAQDGFIGINMMEQMQKANEEARKLYKYCPECGAKNKRSNKFCTDCGTPFSPESMQARATI